MTKLTIAQFEKYQKVMDQLTPAERQDIKSGTFPQHRVQLLNDAGITVKDFYKYVRVMVI